MLHFLIDVLFGDVFVCKESANFFARCISLRLRKVFRKIGLPVAVHEVVVELREDLHFAVWPEVKVD